MSSTIKKRKKEDRMEGKEGGREGGKESKLGRKEEKVTLVTKLPRRF